MKYCSIAVVWIALFCDKDDSMPISLQELCNSSIADVVHRSAMKRPAIQDFLWCCSFIAD